MFITKCLFLVATLIVALIAIVFNNLIQLGFFQSVSLSDEYGNDDCELITSKDNRLYGCEDLSSFDSNGIIIASCENRDAMFKETMTDVTPLDIFQAHGTSDHGSLFLLRPNDLVPQLLPIVGFRPSPDFHPHGIGLIEYGGYYLVSIVNHRREGESIEIYILHDIDTKEPFLTFYDEIHSPLLVNINDVMPVAMDIPNGNKIKMMKYEYFDSASGKTINVETPMLNIGYYVTNMGGFRLKSKLNMLESVFGWKIGDLVYCETSYQSFNDLTKMENEIVIKSYVKCFFVLFLLFLNNVLNL